MSYVIDDMSIWRAIHSCFIDAVNDQEDESRKAISILVGGPTFADFRSGLNSKLLIAQPVPGPDGRPCVGLEILADDGYQMLARIPAETVGLDPEQLADALADTIDNAARRLVEGDE